MKLCMLLLIISLSEKIEVLKHQVSLCHTSIFVCLGARMGIQPSSPTSLVLTSSSYHLHHVLSLQSDVFT